MLPHPVLASEDDAEYVTRTLLTLPELMRNLFECLDAVYTREDGGENNVLATSLYFTIRTHLRILAAVPSDAFHVLDLDFGLENTEEGRRSSPVSSNSKKKRVSELPTLIASLHRLFSEDMLKVGPKALSWKKKCMGLANECADQMRLASVKFPQRYRFHRQVISPSKVLYGLLLLFFFLAVLLSVLIMLAVPAIHPPGYIGLYLAIPAVGFLLFTATAMGFYYVKATRALKRLYQQLFRDAMMFGGNPRVVPGGVGSAAMGLRSRSAALPLNNNNNNSISNNNTNTMNGTLPMFGSTGNNGNGTGQGGEDRLMMMGGGLQLAAGSTTGIPGSGGCPQIQKGYFTIAYGGDVGYIDGRQLDEQVVMIAFDANYHITRWSYAAEELTGFLKEGCLGKPLGELVQTPSGESIVDAIKRGRRKLIKIKLCSLATPPNVLHTVVTPIVNVNHDVVGHMLICANATDKFRHYRTYLHHYVGIHSQEALNRVAKRATLSPEDRLSVNSLCHFMLNATPSHIDELARGMSEWEWTNADQLLGRAFGESLAQHTRMIDPLFPPTICVSPLAAKALGVSVSQRGPSMLNLNVTNLRGTVFALSISITSKNLGGPGGGTASTSNSSNAVWANPKSTLNSKTTKHGGRKFTSSSAQAMEEYARIEASISDMLFGSAGSIALVENRLLLNFPCHVAPIIDEVEDDVEHEAQQQLTQGRHIINCTVNVVTMIHNMVDQYNLSLSLLRTMFVSIASVEDRADLEKRLSAQPCEADVIICDREWMSSCRDLLFSKSHTAIVIPLLANDTPINTSLCQHTIGIPVVSRTVQEIMMEVGRTVSERKNAISAQEEREHILTLRQDSPWTKGKLLGRGSQGAVYEATSDLTGGKMAVKIFYFTSGSSEGSINRLLNEIKIMCSLNHPNIVHYFHSERTDNGVHLFMELCEGSLMDIMARRMKKPDHLGVLQIVRQVLTAITYLHGRGIAHRDVKPQNILLKGDTVKLTDFGTAREGSATKEVGGTLRYMAPEVYRGQDHSLPCDLWSTGCLVCELLRCAPAFMDNAALLADMTSATPYLKNLPNNPFLHDFLHKCFAMEPERRASSRDLLSHLLLRLDTPCSDVEEHSVFNAPLKPTSDEPNFSIMSSDED